MKHHGSITACIKCQTKWNVNCCCGFSYNIFCLFFRPLLRSSMLVCVRSCGATALMRLCRPQTFTEFDIWASDLQLGTPASPTTQRRPPCGAWLGLKRRLVRALTTLLSPLQLNGSKCSFIVLSHDTKALVLSFFFYGTAIGKCFSVIKCIQSTFTISKLLSIK